MILEPMTTDAETTTALREPAPETLKDQVLTRLDADKAVDMIAFDLTGKCDYADYMVIASGTSSRHVSAMTKKLVEGLKDEGVKGIRVEGEQAGSWVIVDAGDVIVHLFRPEVRAFYQLEKIWGDTRRGGDLPADAGLTARAV